MVTTTGYPISFTSQLSTTPPKRGEVCNVGAQELQIERRLAGGAFKDVFGCKDAQTQKSLVMAIPKDWDTALSLDNEFKLVRGKNIVGAQTEGFVETWQHGAQGTPVLIMPRVSGVNIAQELHNRGTQNMAPGEVAGVMAQIARTLHQSHSKGVVHMDIKPENIMIDQAGKTTVIDWGESHAQDQPMQYSVGTPYYMAPEMCQAHRLPLHAHGGMDVFSVGMMTSELATGALPKRGMTGARDWKRAIGTNAPNDLTADPVLHGTVARATRIDPNKRGDALDVMTDLSAFSEARAQFNAHDQEDILGRLVDRALKKTNLQHYDPALAGSSARGWLANMQHDHPRRNDLEKISTQCPPATSTSLMQTASMSPTHDHSGQTTTLPLPQHVGDTTTLPMKLDTKVPTKTETFDFNMPAFTSRRR